MIVDDRYLRAAFDPSATFQRKLEDFLVRRALQERPALVIQAKPGESSLNIDARSNDLCQVLANGSGCNSDNHWWGGFVQSTARPRPSFEGIELVSSVQDPVWASELHTDGHLIAGTWRFPEERDEKGVNRLLLPFFYTRIFSDFASIVGKLQERLLEPSDFEITATLWRATELAFGMEDRFAHKLTARSATRLPLLQWRGRRAENKGELDLVAAAMAADMLGAYGVTP